MKDKLLQIRADEKFLSEIEYLQEVNGFKSVSETVRKIIEKEFRKETTSCGGKNMNERDSLMNVVEELKRFAKENPIEIKTAKQLELTPENLKKVGMNRPESSLEILMLIREPHTDELKLDGDLKIRVLKDRNKSL